MDYKIIRASEHDNLETSVKFWIDRGWKPQGGVSLGETYSHNIFYIQAMIKED